MFKILIAEDDIELRQLFYRVLTLHGYSAICVSDGKEALDVLDKEYVDLIISDIMMPGTDGISFAKHIKSDKLLTHTPLILLSALNSIDDQMKGIDSGAEAYNFLSFSDNSE